MKLQRTSLTVPASNPKFIEKSKNIEVDQVILDLEDSVSRSEKENARNHVIKNLQSGDFKTSISVRINDYKTGLGKADLVEITSSKFLRLDSLILPKIEHPEEVQEVASNLDSFPNFKNTKLQILIETAPALANIFEIARSSKRIEALIFGPGDLAASLGMRITHIGEESEGLDLYYFPRMMILTAARANGLLAIDGPYSNLDDQLGLEKISKKSALLGFDGKWAINPKQIEIINKAFTPTQEEFDKAIAILNSVSENKLNGAIKVEGQMIDEATVQLAERTKALGLAVGLKS